MNIITISREFGSGGRELGKRLSDALGYDYYDKEIIKSIAEKLKMDEKYIESISEKIFVRQFNFHYGYSFSNGLYQNDNSLEILKAQTEILLDIAKKNENFIVIGRSADTLLKDYNPLNIFVYADMDSKIKRCIERDESQEKKDEKFIENEIKKIDNQRKMYCEIIGDGKWGDKERYQLCLNTSNINIKDIIPSLKDYCEAYFTSYHSKK